MLEVINRLHLNICIAILKNGTFQDLEKLSPFSSQSFSEDEIIFISYSTFN